MVAMGWLSDRIGRRPILLGATVLGLIGAWPLFWLMHQADPAFVLLGQLGFVLAVGAFVVPALSWSSGAGRALHDDRWAIT